MDDKIKKLLFDIHKYIILIDTIIGTPRMFIDYKNNITIQLAIERCLEIIGEATHSILKIKPDIAITNARQIVNTRNRFIHEYNRTEPENVWSIVINHLPTLKLEVEKLLNE